MKPALPLFVCALLLAPFDTQDRWPAHRAAAGERRALRFESVVELELGEFEMSLVHEGIELEWWVFPLYTELRAERTVALTDEWLAVEDGAPSRVRRTCDELLEERTFTLLRHVDEQPERRSALAGATVLFERGPEGAWAAELEHRDPRIAPEDLAALAPDLSFGELLPGRAVEPGEAWSVPGSALRGLLEPGGHVDYAPPSAELGPHDPLDARLFDALAGELRLRFESIEERAGRRLAVLSIGGEVAGELALEDSGPQAARLGDSVRKDGEEEVRAAIHFEPEGALRWDLDQQRLFAVEVELAVELDEQIQSRSRDRRTAGEYRGAWSGTWTVRASIPE